MPAYASAKPNATMAAVSNYDDTPGLKMVSSGGKHYEQEAHFAHEFAAPDFRCSFCDVQGREWDVSATIVQNCKPPAN